MVAPSGGVKTELIRSYREYPKSYSLDYLTSHTLVSGLAEKDRDGNTVPRAGILQDLDGKVLHLKDFTTILSSSEENRQAIYGQLRSAFDGYYEAAFGTMREPVRVSSRFGLVAGVTPAIDKYTQMNSLLGERFLMVRSSPNPLEATKRASTVSGRETQMRMELRAAASSFIKSLRFQDVPGYSVTQEEALPRIGGYVARMRTSVWARYDRGTIVDMDPVEGEVPTRVTKQLKKLGQLLAIINGHESVTEAEIQTLRRVARDTCDPKRQKIIEAFHYVGFNAILTQADVVGHTRGLYYGTVQNQLQIMKVLDILTESSSLYRVNDSFREYIDAVYPPATREKESKTRSFLKGTLMEAGLE